MLRKLAKKLMESIFYNEALSLDYRSDCGYGRASSSGRYDPAQSSSNNYPYTDPDPYEDELDDVDVEMDDDIIGGFIARMATSRNHAVSAPIKRPNQGGFVDGNTTLSVYEYTQPRDFHRANLKPKSAAISYQVKGTKQGWVSAPPETPDPHDIEDVDGYHLLFDLEDALPDTDERILVRTRRETKKIKNQNEKA